MKWTRLSTTRHVEDHREYCWRSNVAIRRQTRGSNGRNDTVTRDKVARNVEIVVLIAERKFSIGLRRRSMPA